MQPGGATLDRIGVDASCRCPTPVIHGAWDLGPCVAAPHGVTCPLRREAPAGDRQGGDQAWAHDPPELWLG